MTPTEKELKAKIDQMALTIEVLVGRVNQLEFDREDHRLRNKDRFERIEAMLDSMRR